MSEKTTSTRELHLKRKAMWDSSMANHSRYLDEKTGLFRNEFLENRACPTCGSTDERQLFHKSGGTYVACNQCETVFLNPVFTDAEIENYYRTNHDLQSTIVAQDFGFYRRLYTKGLEMFSPSFSSSTKAILDIGCSAGGFLNIAKEFGWKTFGLEYNQGEAKVARQNGHEVFEMNIKSFLKTSDQKFDVVTLWDVFEHIKNGQELLQDVYKVLTPNGGVFLQSPTPTSLAARILQEKCNMFDGLEHCNLYTLENVKTLAEKTGFVLEGYDTVISEAGVIANYLDYKNPYLGELNKNSHSNFFSEDEILKNKLGYKFQIFLKKKTL